MYCRYITFKRRPSIFRFSLTALSIFSLTALDAQAQSTPSSPRPYNEISEAGRASTANDYALTAADSDLYSKAFAAIDRSDFSTADAYIGQISDPILMAYVEFHKLFSPTYISKYEELTSWLERYGDHPLAMRVWSLAKRKKPSDAPDPAYPTIASINNNGAVALSGSTITELKSPSGKRTSGDSHPQDTDLTLKSARSAYNNGNMAESYRLGLKIGDHWVAGLAAWRLKHYDQALIEFKFVTTDPSQNAWSQSGGAYWAGRAAMRLGKDEEANTYFKIAASYPFTFYGLVAEQRLGITPAVVLSKKGLPPVYETADRQALSASLSLDPNFVETHSEAKRLMALASIGRKDDAAIEMRAGMQRASSHSERSGWLALGAQYDLQISPIASSDRSFDQSLYPLPNFSPKGGYKVSKALLFAIARKESKFNQSVKSYAGAYGLMQLMPATAAVVTGDPKMAQNPDVLLKADMNLYVGQNYVLRLLDTGIVNGDLIRAIAAYNAGPRPVQDAVRSLGEDTDPLLMMESIPVAQTRQYVEEVTASYWIYRHILGLKSPTLIQAASDVKTLRASDDWK